MNNINNMTPEEIAQAAANMLNHRNIPNHQFYHQGPTIITRSQNALLSVRHNIIRYSSNNNYVADETGNEKVRVTNLTDVANVIQNSL